MGLIAVRTGFEPAFGYPMIWEPLPIHILRLRASTIPPPDYVWGWEVLFFCGYTGTRTQTIWRGHQTYGNPTSHHFVSFISTLHRCTHISSQDRIRTCNRSRDGAHREETASTNSATWLCCLVGLIPPCFIALYHVFLFKLICLAVRTGFEPVNLQNKTISSSFYFLRSPSN